jgi:hypothetical protein
MNQLLAIAISFALVLGATALAVDRFHDRELFVPPPDAVAEGFVRAVVCGRYEPARAYLNEPSSVSEKELRALDESLGEAWDVEAKLISHDDARAVADVRVSGAKALALELVFDGEWKIVRIRNAGVSAG